MIEKKYQIYLNLKDLSNFCEKCELYRTRNKVVWGSGDDENSDIIFIGEAPGREEDLDGIPFIGSSGKLLRKILTKEGFDLYKTFITNVVMCRPPKNRDPTKEEKEICSMWLKSKIYFIKPKLIVPIGKHSISFTMNMNLEEIKITKMSGNLYEGKDGISIIPLLHPAYILRNRNKQEEYEKHIRFIYDYARKNKLKGVMEI